MALFCQSHPTALTPELEQAQGKNRVACVWLWTLILYLHTSWEKTCRNVSAVAAFFQKESDITTLYSNLFLTSPRCPSPNKGADLQHTTAVENYWESTYMLH